MYKAILFDLDGTLINSMRYHFISWQNILKTYDIKIKESDYYPLEGMSLEKIAEKFTKKLLLNKYQIKEIVDLKKSFYISMCSRNKINFYDNALSFIELLYKKKIPIGLVTASHLSQITQTLDDSFLKKFTIIISGEQLKQPKPHPESYLKAVKYLNLSSKECIAVENSPLGIKSAKKAKTYCIAISSTNNKDILFEADQIINNFNEISSCTAIKELLKNI